MAKARNITRWVHTGGGCLIGTWARGVRYPCDFTYERRNGRRRECATFRCTRHAYVQLDVSRMYGSLRTVIDLPGVREPVLTYLPL